MKTTTVLMTTMLLSFLMFTSCDSKKNTTPVEPVATSEESSTSTDPVDAMDSDASGETTDVANNQEATELCPNGDSPKRLSGNCSGTWEVVQTEDGPSCDFKWGPTVTCPEGSEGLVYKSVCYGTTSKPAKGKTLTAKSCIDQFGKTPISARYELSCCSK